MSAPAEDNPASAWEERLDEILRAEGDNAEASQKLLALLPGLPAPAQVEVVQHLLNLTEDDHYAPVAGLLTNTNTAPDVLELVMTDLLGRPNSVQLPLLLEVARQPGHPRAAEAREMLEFHLSEDFGEDWARWEAAIRQYLKENPD